MGYQTTTNRLNAYRQTRVKTASPGQMIVMLYDEAIKQLDLAASLLEEKTKQLDRVHNAIVAAQSCVTELTVGLDFEKGGEIAENLYSLYRFFNRQLLEANLKKDVGPLRSVRKMLNELRQSWQQIVQQQGAGHDQEEAARNHKGINFAG
ncbi:MAG: flagellar export chaperone FliS [Spirochaetaceae bacterium]